MSMSDPIADMLTRIRNSQRVGHVSVRMPSSTKKESVVKVLVEEGYVNGYKIEELDSNKRDLIVELRYFEGNPVIDELHRVSSPGLRVFKNKDELPTVRGGLGIAIVSTSEGVMTDRAARTRGVGGEVICLVS